MLILLGFQLVVTVFSIIFQDQILQWAAEKQSNNAIEIEKFKELIDENVEIATYVGLGVTIVQVNSEFVFFNNRSFAYF